jgi:hypothetical protein
MRLDEFPSSASGRGINLKIGGNLQEAEASGLPKERTRTPAIRRLSLPITSSGLELPSLCLFA